MQAETSRPLVWRPLAQRLAAEGLPGPRVNALLATLAVHDKAAGNAAFVNALALIEAAAGDERNFVKKAVNWALRNIGKRNVALNHAAIAAARRIQAQGSRAARWIAADAHLQPGPFRARGDAQPS